MARVLLLLLALLGAVAARAQSPDRPKTCPYDSAHFDLFHPVPRNQLRELRPDRPGVTESPFTVDAGHFQLEVDGFRLINRREDNQREREWHAAYLMPKLGLSRRTDLQLEIPVFATQKQRQSDDPNWERQRGFGDVAVRLKHNFLGDDEECPVALAAVGWVRLPTGGLAGAGGAEYGLIVPVDVNLGHHWDAEGQVETKLCYDRETRGHYLGVVPSVALEHDFNDLFSFMVEGVARWDAQHSGWRNSVNVAPMFNLNDNLQVDFGAHFALNRETDREFFVGFTFRR
ncbi:transporter [Hymenobacter edaphi]|nr:transporter [Hymenobacter edaphi]